MIVQEAAVSFAAFRSSFLRVAPRDLHSAVGIRACNSKLALFGPGRAADCMLKTWTNGLSFHEASTCSAGCKKGRKSQRHS